MNMSPRLADYLRDAGFDARHWSWLGRAEATDDTIAAYAVAEASVVVTHDLDFGAILAATAGLSPSVVIIRDDDLSVAALGEKLTTVLLDLAGELDTGALVIVDTARVRIRILPLRPQ